MSKTYNLTATLNTGKNSALNDGNWSGYASTNVSSSEVGSIGRTSGPLFYATNMVFDSATLNTLRNKTINGVTLTLVITQGTDAPALVAWKYNSTSSGNTNSQAWARSNNSGTLSAGDASIATNANPSFAAGEVTTGTKTLTLKGLPQYGLVAGPFSDSRNGVWKISSATLNVTTNETDYSYTLSYNANGGSGAPSSQTGSNTGTSPYYTFTVSSTVPTRTGYTFLGWSTSDSATSASYVGGNSFTVTSSGTTTLYAVWKVNTYTVSYNANGGTGAPPAQTKTYNVSLTLSSTVPTRTGYIFQGWATSSTGVVAYQPSGSYTANAAVTLYAIWKAANSTLSSVTNTNIGSSGTASWNKIDNSYTYKLVLTYSNAPAVTVNVAANNASTSFSIPTTWYAYLPNSTSATATATLTTYSGSTALGTSTKTFTVSVASSIKPSISAFTAAPRSSNTTVSGWNVYVQGYSYVYLSATASAGTGASIVSYAFSGAGLSQTGTSTTANSTVIDSSGSKTYTLVVTDSRGRWAEAKVYPNFLAYSNPVVSSLTSYRSNSSGEQASIDGTYIHSTPSFTFSAVGNNALTVKKIEYKLHTASSWTTGVSSANSDIGYTFGGGNIAITSSYDVKCTVTDSLGNSGTYTALVPPIVGFAVGLNNDRARFGGPVEKAGLQIDWPVDVTPRRCFATLSSANKWFRAIKIEGQNFADGGSGFELDIVIAREYWQSANEIHSIKFQAVSSNFRFIGEHSTTKNLYIDEIRFVRESNDVGYIDIHYNTSSQNGVYVGFTAHNYWQESFTASDLSETATSPVVGSVVTEYVFTSNTDKPIDFSPAVGTADFGGCWFSLCNDLVTVSVGLTGLTNGTPHTIYTLPSHLWPKDQACVVGSGVSYTTYPGLFVRSDGKIQVYVPSGGLISAVVTYMRKR